MLLWVSLEEHSNFQADGLACHARST